MAKTSKRARRRARVERSGGVQVVEPELDPPVPPLRKLIDGPVGQKTRQFGGKIRDGRAGDLVRRFWALNPGKWFTRGIFVLTGAIALVLPPLSMYTLFLIALWRRQWIAERVAQWRLSHKVTWRLWPRTTLALSIFAAGMLFEALSWLNEYLDGDKRVALLHPQLGADLLIAVGLYAGWAISWVLATRFFKFGLLSACVIHGIFGVVGEQRGIGGSAAYVAVPTGFVLWAYVFVIYASTMGLAWVIAEARMSTLPERTRTGWMRMVGTFLGLVFITTMATGYWTWLLKYLDWLPKAQSIRHHPFW